MKISPKSWHYNLVQLFFTGNMPRTLCSYFWTFLLCLFFGLLLATFALGLVAGAIYVLVAPWILIGEAKNREEYILIGIMFFMGYGFPVIGFIINYIESRPKNYRPSKGPSLLSQWLKAKKEKVCPIIEYKD